LPQKPRNKFIGKSEGNTPQKNTKPPDSWFSSFVGGSPHRLKIQKGKKGGGDQWKLGAMARDQFETRFKVHQGVGRGKRMNVGCLKTREKTNTKLSLVRKKEKRQKEAVPDWTVVREKKKSGHARGNQKGGKKRRKKKKNHQGGRRVGLFKGGTARKDGEK